MLHLFKVLIRVLRYAARILKVASILTRNLQESSQEIKEELKDDQR